VLAVMPNPFNEQTEIFFREVLTAQHRIQLIDMNGQVVRELVPQGQRVVVERGGLPAGFYSLRAIAPDGGMTVVRLVVGP